MDDQIVAELNALRARAYGRGGGLGEDPEALRRLGDLEELVRPRPADPGEVGALPAASEPAKAEPAAVVVPAGTVEATDADGEPEVAPAPRLRMWWTRRRIAILWLASLVAVALVATTVSAAFTYRLQADTREVAVLRVDAGAQWPEIFGEEVGHIFADFYGIRAFSQVQGSMAGPGRSECLQVAESSILDADLRQGFPGRYYAGSCGAGAFPPTAAILVGEGAPEPLRERFPDGTSLQFILRGSEVVVLAVPPQPEPEPSIEAAR